MKLASWSSPLVEKREGSRIKGIGLFARERILKDELIAVKAGHLVDEAYILEHQDLIRGSHMQVNDNLFLAPTTEEEWQDTLIGFNHSCEPNAYVKGTILFKALRDIEPGEEITTDYATIYTSDSQSFECLCKTVSCRKHIKPSVDWQNPALQLKYKGHFLDFIQTKIDKENGEVI